MYDMILIRYGEMTLKKSNYKHFLRKMNDNIKSKLSVFPNLKFNNTDYRFYIYLNGTPFKDVTNVIDKIVGISSYSLCKKTTNKLEDIASTGVEVISDSRLNEYINKESFTFKIETNRGDKQYPLTSLEISKEVANLILPKIENMKVDVHNPDITLYIDLRSEGTYLYTSSISALGGYPSGMGGSGLVMMSGGIDSPVASFLAIKKGIKISAIHFASPPYTSLNALQKVIDLLEQLCLYNDSETISLYVVPFTKIQDSIHNNASNIYMVTLMRRSMYRIADEFIKNNNINCIINGESIGQVASQTLESMQVVNEVTNSVILRPLASFDKNEIIKIARKINTYDISIKPYEDCCTVFVPEHPVIKPILKNVLEEENKCSLESLEKEALENIEVFNISTKKKISVFDNDDKFEI